MSLVTPDLDSALVAAALLGGGLGELDEGGRSPPRSCASCDLLTARVEVNLQHSRNLGATLI